jgi:hypothetical protein
MRTAIYVYDPDSVSPVEFGLSSDAVIYRYEGPNSESPVVNDNGRCKLTRGIYKVMSTGPLQISPDRSINYDLVAVVNDKDPWPDPPARFQETFASVSLTILREFLPAGKGGFGVSANDS